MTEYNSQPKNDLIGDILKDYTRNGGMDNVPKGKKISKEYLSMDTYQHFQKIASEAGYKPYWIELQHEIKKDIISVLEMIGNGKKRDLSLRISMINNKIHKFNKSCPPALQKGSVSKDNIHNVKNSWI